MDIKPRKPQTAFDFGIAVTLPFRSTDGRGFIFRLAGWMTVFFTLVYVLIIPFIAPSYGEMMEYNWLNMQATLGGAAPPDPDAMLGSFVKLIPAYIAMTLGMWVVLASGEAALHRKFYAAKKHRDFLCALVETSFGLCSPSSAFGSSCFWLTRLGSC